MANSCLCDRLSYQYLIFKSKQHLKVKSRHHTDWLHKFTVVCCTFVILGLKWIMSMYFSIVISLFWRSTVWVLCGHLAFHPYHDDQWPQTSNYFHPICCQLLCLCYLNSWERASISLSVLSVKQGNHWYHIYIVFGMTRSLTRDWTHDLTHSMPALYH